MASHNDLQEHGGGADHRMPGSSDNSSSQRSTEKQGDDGASIPRRQGSREQGSGGAEEDSESLPLKRRLDDSLDFDEANEKDDNDDAEYRRMRRRITNRESAKRMRIKRQEELANFQKELKRVSLENEQLRRYSAQLQKQHLLMATDVQHWQSKYTSANSEVTAIFQQLQQVVALSAAFNPAILEVLGTTNTAPTTPQAPVLDALMQALPQTRILSEAMEALRTSNGSNSVISSFTSLASPPGGVTPPPDPLPGALPATGPLSAASLTAIRLAAAAHAEGRSGPLLPSQASQGRLLAAQPTRDTAAPPPTLQAELLMPRPRRAATAFTGLARQAGDGSVGIPEQPVRSLSNKSPSYDLEASLKASQQRLTAKQ